MLNKVFPVICWLDNFCNDLDHLYSGIGLPVQQVIQGVGANEERIFKKKLKPNGLKELDDILQGALPLGRVCRVEDSPGVGKTTMGLQFPRKGALAGENPMRVILIETHQETFDVAKSQKYP